MSLVSARRLPVAAGKRDSHFQDGNYSSLYGNSPEEAAFPERTRLVHDAATVFVELVSVGCFMVWNKGRGNMVRSLTR